MILLTLLPKLYERRVGAEDVVHGADVRPEVILSDLADDQGRHEPLGSPLLRDGVLRGLPDLRHGVDGDPVEGPLHQVGVGEGLRLALHVPGEADHRVLDPPGAGDDGRALEEQLGGGGDLGVAGGRGHALVLADRVHVDGEGEVGRGADEVAALAGGRADVVPGVGGRGVGVDLATEGGALAGGAGHVLGPLEEDRRVWKRERDQE